MLEGNVCLDSILKNHILPNVICSAALGPKSRTINLLDDYIFISNDEDNNLKVEDAKVLEKDIMANNGVIYAIDQPLIPSEAMPLIEVLSSKNLTRFIDLIETAEMLDDFSKLTDVTVFAPSNDAIDALEQEVLDDLMEDKDTLRELLNYHITSSALRSSEINNNHVMDTRAEHPLKMNLYTSFPLLTSQFRRTPVKMTAGCSRISDMDNRACGGVVHVIDQLLDVPKQSLLERLEAEETFSIFSQMIKDVGMTDKLSEDGSLTVLAPSDFVFKALPQDELDMILENREIKEAIARKHILKEQVCCSGINSNTWLFMDHKRALDGTALHVRRTHNGRLMAGPARITDCGSPAKNGVIHTVNHILHHVDSESPKDINNRQSQRRIFRGPGLDVYFQF